MRSKRLRTADMNVCCDERFENMSCSIYLSVAQLTSSHPFYQVLCLDPHFTTRSAEASMTSVSYVPRAMQTAGGASLSEVQLLGQRRARHFHATRSMLLTILIPARPRPWCARARQTRPGRFGFNALTKPFRRYGPGCGNFVGASSSSSLILAR